MNNVLTAKALGFVVSGLLLVVVSVAFSVMMGFVVHIQFEWKALSLLTSVWSYAISMSTRDWILSKLSLFLFTDEDVEEMDKNS